MRFNDLREEPLVARYIPPVSGAISWTRLTLNTVKYGIVRFLQSQPEIFDEDEGRDVKQKYITLAHTLRDYEVEQFKVWDNDIVVSLNARLSQPILYRNPNIIPFRQVSTLLPSMHTSALHIMKHKRRAMTQTN